MDFVPREYLSYDGEGEPPLEWHIAYALAPYILGRWDFEERKDAFDMTNNSGRDLCMFAARAVMDTLAKKAAFRPVE